jgi:hypothetical protein
MRDKVKMYIKIAIWATILTFVVVYTAIEIKDLVRGPQINISSPENGSSFVNPQIKIKGSAKLITSLAMNNRPVYTDEQGNFSEKLILLPGYNIIGFTAKDRFGRTITKTLELVSLEK